jgi:hypothetical protein
VKVPACTSSVSPTFTDEADAHATHQPDLGAEPLDIFGRTGGHGRRRPVQCWVALVRLLANEAVEVLEAAAGRQTVERPGRFGVVL